MLWNLGPGLKLGAALLLGKFGTSGLAKPLIIVDRLSVSGFLDDLLILLKFSRFFVFSLFSTPTTIFSEFQLVRSVSFIFFS